MPGYQPVLPVTAGLVHGISTANRVESALLAKCPRNVSIRASGVGLGLCPYVDRFKGNSWFRVLVWMLSYPYFGTEPCKTIGVTAIRRWHFDQQDGVQ